jgi:hypothetical protein
MGEGSQDILILFEGGAISIPRSLRILPPDRGIKRFVKNP